MIEVYRLIKSVAFFEQTLNFHNQECSPFYWVIDPISYSLQSLDAEFSTENILAAQQEGVFIPRAYVSIRYSCPEGIVFTAKTQREYMFELQEKCTGKLTIKADDDEWPSLQPLWLELRATLMRWEVIE